jgi:hypothetical protein
MRAEPNRFRRFAAKNFLRQKKSGGENQFSSRVEVLVREERLVHRPSVDSALSVSSCWLPFSWLPFFSWLVPSWLSSSLALEESPLSIRRSGL